MAEIRTLLSDLVFVESPRWHAGRLWFSDWGARTVLAVDLEGHSEVVARMQSMPFCVDWTHDNRLLIVAGREAKVLELQRDRSMPVLADLSGLSRHPWNEIVVHPSGNSYVNNIGFDFPGGEVQPGTIALVTPDGSARQVADGLMFPNGMAITPDGSTLIVAESYGGRLTAFNIEDNGALTNRRIWADLGGAPPDGICLDSEGAVWYADVPNHHCVRVAEGGEVLQTLEVDRGCFSCALGGTDGRALFIVAAEWPMPADGSLGRTGQVLMADAPAPAAG